MQTLTKLALVGTITAMTVGAAAAQSVESAVKARKGHMQLYAFNLGPLGAMAKGEAEYDAASAATFAASLSALTALDQSRYWPEGSAQGQVDGTRALPAIWENGEDVMAKAVALNEAVAALRAAAGSDLAALQGAMGPVGQACGACHEDYRAPQ